MGDINFDLLLVCIFALIIAGVVVAVSKVSEWYHEWRRRGQ